MIAPWVITPKNVALGYDVGKISTGCVVHMLLLSLTRYSYDDDDDDDDVYTDQTVTIAVSSVAAGTVLIVIIILSQFIR